jgi:hypothetical protein
MPGLSRHNSELALEKNDTATRDKVLKRRIALTNLLLGYFKSRIKSSAIIHYCSITWAACKK